MTSLKNKEQSLKIDTTKLLNIPTKQVVIIQPTRKSYKNSTTRTSMLNRYCKIESPIFPFTFLTKCKSCLKGSLTALQ